MKFSFKNIAIIIGVILALAIVAWYVISDMQVQKYKQEDVSGHGTHQQ